MALNFTITLATTADADAFLKSRSYVVGCVKCPPRGTTRDTPRALLPRRAPAPPARSLARPWWRRTLRRAGGCGFRSPGGSAAPARRGRHPRGSLCARLPRRARAPPAAARGSPSRQHAAVAVAAPACARAHHIHARASPALPRSFAPTGTDAALFEAFGKAPDAAKHPHAARYYAHIASFSADARKKWGPSLGSAGVGAPVTAAPPKAPAAAPAAADDDEADLFGDDGDAAAAAVKVEKPVAAADAKKSKPKPIAKTICVYDVKPLEAETPPSALEAAVRSIQMDGLSWGETFKVEEIAYGVKKLVVQCVVEDEKVSLDELEEKLMSFEDIIQSIDQLSMNKIT